MAIAQAVINLRTEMDPSFGPRAFGNFSDTEDGNLRRIDLCSSAYVNSRRVPFLPIERSAAARRVPVNILMRDAEATSVQQR